MQPANEFTPIAHPAPTTTIRKPLIAGPIRPPRCQIDALTLIALLSRAWPTISLTNTFLAGWSTMSTKPSRHATR